MTTMRKFPGYTCCNRRLLVHIPPQRGHESRFHGACLRGERLLGPSSFQAPTAAALPGLGATVTSHPGDILKGASQHELWVGRTSTSAVLTHLLHNVREIRGRSSSGVRKSIYLQVGRFSEPLSGKWYVRHLSFLFCFLFLAMLRHCPIPRFSSSGAQRKMPNVSCNKEKTLHVPPESQALNPADSKDIATESLPPQKVLKIFSINIIAQGLPFYRRRVSVVHIQPVAEFGFGRSGNARGHRTRLPLFTLVGVAFIAACL